MPFRLPSSRHRHRTSQPPPCQHGPSFLPPLPPRPAPPPDPPTYESTITLTDTDRHAAFRTMYLNDRTLHLCISLAHIDSWRPESGQPFNYRDYMRRVPGMHKGEVVEAYERELRRVRREKAGKPPGYEDRHGGPPGYGVGDGRWE